ncbi:nuclear receptor coactivator 2 isoform X3 [Macrosteles quadrilineatus]|uniref:nuclear receptor coactivator 2 isoform X3 n=1 Tax=Macrosteles quadrilineatus TaxID=74068 RepID=UPI0023E2E553|nr:nuclear receptor coactivator 2 isoform X3 [Macrosteles quadrilineatus]
MLILKNHLCKDNFRLGPHDLQDWTKMSSVTAGVNNKKRKKQEPKAQSQINKCLNEKRRREQENIHIEELAELISASFTEMSSLSVKPDKCAILQETVNQVGSPSQQLGRPLTKCDILEEAINKIRSIKQQEITANCDAAVQQGEVSSSKPTIIAHEIFGPLLLEALEGFLFVVSKEGNVEFVTDNVTNFLNYSREEVLGKCIYNFIHHGDHVRFNHVLMPVSNIGWLPGVDQAQKNRTFTCRLLVKPPDEQETMEEKQQRVSKYENMQISSTQVPFPGNKSGEGSGGGEECGDFGPCLMCVARRIPQNEKHLQLGAPIEQFAIKLEPSGKIVAVDASGLSSNYSQYINKDLINWNIHELVHPADKGKAANYLRDMLGGSGNNDSVSPIYRLRVSHTQDKYVHVQTKAKFFKCSGNAESDFVMATHSIINDNDVVAAEANSPQCSQSSGSGSVGGPLMGSVNGNVREGMMSTNFTSFSSNNDLNYDFMDFPTSTLVGELGMMTEERPWDRPESRHSTPAPSPHPSFAPAQPSPYQSTISFPFSPIPDQPPPLEETKETRKDSTDNGSSSEGDSARLRNLLLMKRPSVDSDEGGGGGGQKHQVLKTLLNQEEEDPSKTRPASDPPTPTPKASSGNNMLLKLLNEKSDDDDHESRAGLKKQNELLTQLLKEEENKNQHSHIDGQQEDPLLKSLGFSPSPEGVGRARKRPSEEGDEPPAKRGPLSTLDTLPPVSTSAPSNSKLWEKNKMLASLLAKQPSNPTPAQIPPIPASVISATPQDKLPRIIKQQGWSGGSIQQSGVLTRPTQQMVDSVARQRAPQQYQQQQYNNNNNSWDHNQRTSDQLSDQFLSDILDQVIDIVPDAIATDPASIMDLLDQMGETPVTNSGQFQQTMSEKMAINAIQKSLMQCETVVKSPTYPTNTMGQTQQGFPGPPPMYSTRPRFSVQQGQQITIRPGTPQYAIANQQQQQLLVQQRLKIQQAQQQKQRLLQQQQQQQLLIPINAAASGDGLHNIDSLINNTVAPNVSLQRSSSVNDSQLSPSNLVASGGGGPMLNSTSQISPSQRQPYSPLSHQPFSPVNGGINNFQAGGQSAGQQQANAQARLSPSGLPTFQQAQLSPRVSQAQQAGGGYTVMSQAGSWPQQQARLTLQQQQNPMLNAQLTGGAYTNNRTFVSQQQQVQQQQQQRPNQPQQLPPVRSLTSPSARQSPFPADGTQYRLQRTISAPPQATTQLPGGVRHYAASPMKEHHPLLSPSYPPQPHPHQPHQMMYPESSQFCFDQNSLQLYGATCDRARLPGGAGGNNGMTEYVRQELRAMVGARQQQVRILPGQVSPADFEALGLSFEMSNQGGGESPKMNWGNMNSDMSAVSPQSAIQRTGMEEVSRSSDPSRSSLLQKLLSE